MLLISSDTMFCSSKKSACIVIFSSIITFEATFSNASAWLFSDLGNYCSFTAFNPAVNSFAFLRYDIIVASFAKYVPCTCLTTNCESLKTFIEVAPIYLTNRKPTNSASYLASLFVAEKPKRNECSNKSSTGLLNKIPAPNP